MHNWEIFGTVMKLGKRPYHNNFIFYCTHCPMAQVTVNNKKSNVLEFENLTALAEFLVNLKYSVNLWPMIKE